MPDDYAASTATTGTVAIGGSATGVIEKARDVDWFAVHLVAGRTYVFDMAGADGGGGTLGDTKLLGVFDDEGSRVAGKSDGGGEGGDARLVYTASETGTFYIAGRGGGRDDTGTYTMRVRDRDPDSLAAGAADLGDLGGARLVRKDSVDGGADAADYWRFALSETQAVTLGLRRQDANADLYLEDGDGKVLHSSTSGGTRAEAITATLEAGTYYVRVAAQEAGDNDYWLRARAEDPAPAVQPEQTPVHSPPPAETPAQPQPQQTAKQQQVVPQQPTVLTSVSEPAGTDFSADTSTAGRVAVGGSATGRVGAWFDVDWFAVTLEKGKVYVIDLRGWFTDDGGYTDDDKVYNPYLRGIYDASGKFIRGTKADDGGAGLNSRAYFTADETDTYYVAAGAYEYGTGTYTVSVAEVKGDDSDDFTADTRTTGKVTVGGSATGKIGATHDWDWFAVTLEKGKTYRINLNGSDTEDGTLSDPEIRGIYDASGNLVAGTADDDGGTGTNSQVIFTAAADATYYVAASGYLDATGTYTLSVAEGTDDFAADYNTTGTVPVGGSRAAKIDYAGDIDWFAVDMLAGSTYRIDLAEPSTRDDAQAGVVLHQFHDMDGNRLAGTGSGSQDTFTPHKNGTYYVRAGGIGDHTGPYTVSVANVTPARLRNVSEPRGNDFSEDEDTAGRVTVGGSIKGRMNHWGDHDWVAVELEAGRTYQFEMKATKEFRSPGDMWNPKLFGIYDVNGNLYPDTRNDDGDGYNSKVFFAAPETSIYYVQAGSAFFKSKGPYRLSVTEAPDDFAADTGTAGAVAVSGVATGEITITRDVDWFAVTLEAGNRYQIDLKGRETGDGTLPDPELHGIHDADGNRIAGTGNSDNYRAVGDYADRYNSRVFFTPDEDGTYYLAAGVPQHKDGQNAANYGTYTVVVTDTSTDDYAGGTATTGAVAVGGSAAGRVETPNDRDWFAVTLEAGKTYQFDLAGSPGGGYALRDPALHGIHDAGGNLIAGTTNDDGGPGNASRVLFTATESGTYYVAAGADGTDPDISANYYRGITAGRENRAADFYGEAGVAGVKLDNLGAYTLSVEETDAM